MCEVQDSVLLQKEFLKRCMFYILFSKYKSHGGFVSNLLSTIIVFSDQFWTVTVFLLFGFFGWLVVVLICFPNIIVHLNKKETLSLFKDLLIGWEHIFTYDMKDYFKINHRISY